MALISIGELARMLERDPKAIRRAVETGRITRRPDGLFDTTTVLQEWENTTNHELGHNNRTKKVVEMVPPTAASEPELPMKEDKEVRGNDFAKARAASQIYDARLKKLRYEEKAGILVPARDVEDAAHKALRCIRDACMSIPSRVANQVAHETSVERCFQILEAEINSVFEDFAEGKIA
jgi:hypothetical protein